MSDHRRKARFWSLVAAACTASALLIAPSRAHAGGDYEIPWFTIDGGGGVSTGGDFVLSGTIGQPDTGGASGGDFVLAGGFWGGICDFGPACPPDINGDGVVDIGDLLLLMNQWGPCGNPANCPADLTADGVVDIADLLVLLSNWGAACP